MNQTIDPATATIVVAGIVAVQTIVVAKISNRVKQVQKDSAETKAQVKNSHETNFRDDLDRNTELVEKLTSMVQYVISEQKDQKGDLVGIRKEMRADRQAVRTLTKQFTAHLAKSK